MKIGIVVNIMGSVEGSQSTYRLAAGFHNKGHEVWLISSGNFAFDEDDQVHAFARRAPGKHYSSSESYLKTINSLEVKEEEIIVDDLDCLFLRNNPTVQTPWAQYAAIHYGRIAMRHGVIVLNDPNGLYKAMNKLYLQGFPEEVRPKTLISRNQDKIKIFLKKYETIILKPLQGSQGKNVFRVRAEDDANLNQIITAVSRDGYVIAQEYLPEAEIGDTRLFLLNGRPLKYKGHYCAFRRMRTGEDLRSNVHVGGKIRKAEITDEMLYLAELARPNLVMDGMFFVGLDIVGKKIMEINVFSPGGLGNVQHFEKVDFVNPIIEAVERKVDTMRYYHKNFKNQKLATL
jgi:glutathione synthase